MKKLFLKLIDIYQNIRKNDGKAHCRFTPTCSNYAKECFQKFNFFKALFLSIFRIIRCNPLSKGGYNPVPLTKKEKIKIKKENDKLLKALDFYQIYLVNHI